jgi:hypothetical protein
LTKALAYQLIQRFFFTRKEFGRKDGVKSVVDVKKVLCDGESEDEMLAESAIYVVFSVVVCLSRSESGDYERSIFEENKEEICKLIYSTFKKCKFLNGKKNLSLSFVYVEEGSDFGESYSEIRLFSGRRSREIDIKSAFEATENVMERLKCFFLSFFFFFSSFSHYFILSLFPSSLFSLPITCDPPPTTSPQSVIPNSSSSFSLSLSLHLSLQPLFFFF